MTGSEDHLVHVCEYRDPASSVCILDVLWVLLVCTLPFFAK